MVMASDSRSAPYRLPARLQIPFERAIQLFCVISYHQLMDRISALAVGPPLRYNGHIAIRRILTLPSIKPCLIAPFQYRSVNRLNSRLISNVTAISITHLSPRLRLIGGGWDIAFKAFQFRWSGRDWRNAPPPISCRPMWSA